MDEQGDEQVAAGEQAQAPQGDAQGEAPPARRPGTFTKGDPRINRKGTIPRGQGRAAKADGTEELDPLEEMLAVARDPEGTDGGPYRQSLRKQFVEDFREFQRQLVGLQGKKKAGVDATAESESGTDEGTARAIELGERLLKEWGES